MTDVIALLVIVGVYVYFFCRWRRAKTRSEQRVVEEQSWFWPF